MQKFKLITGFSVASAALALAGQVQAFTFQTPPASMPYHNGPSSGTTSVKTDSQGNMYVSIISKNENGKIIKYAPNGQTAWIRDFDPNNARPTDKSPYVTSSGVSAVAVDRNDNIYAVGESFNGASLDCLLKKYNSNGDLLWQTRHTVPMSGTTGADQYCNDITIDKAGDIIAGGTSLNFSGTNASTYGNQILKWNVNGTLIGKFNLPTNGQAACGPALPCASQILKVVTDLNQNIYTVERNGTMYANRYAKYSPSLQLLTATQLHNPFAEPYSFRQWAIAVDTQGHVYGSGYENVPNASGGSDQYSKLIVMDSDLNQLCEDKRLYAPPSNDHDPNDFYRAIVIGPNELAYVAGSESKDFIVMEYNAQCQPQWVDAAGNAAPLKARVDYRNYTNAVTLDKDNNLIIAGASLKSDLITVDAVTAKFIRNVTPTNSDLRISAFFTNPTAKTGQAIPTGGYVTNYGTGTTGSAASGAHWLGFYLSADSVINRQDILLCRAPVDAQTAGTTLPYGCVGTPPANLTTSTYYLGVIADDGNVIAETVETNNSASQQVPYTALSDLIALSGSAPTSAQTGQQITVSGSIKNQGIGVATTGSTAGIYISSDSTITASDTQICTAAVGSLAVGASQTVSCTGTIPATTYAGNYYVGVLADKANALEETDEGNNGWSQAITLTAKSDLVITTAASPASAQRGTQITVSGTVKNQGYGPTSPYFVRVRLSQDNVITSTDTVLCGFGFASTPANTALPFSCSATIPATLAAGSYSLGFVADDGNYVTESNETNNIKLNAITITQ